MVLLRRLKILLGARSEGIPFSKYSWKAMQRIGPLKTHKVPINLECYYVLWLKTPYEILEKIPRPIVAAEADT